MKLRGVRAPGRARRCAAGSRTPHGRPPQARCLRPQGRPNTTQRFPGNVPSSDHQPSEQPDNRTSDHRIAVATKLGPPLRCVGVSQSVPGVRHSRGSASPILPILPVMRRRPLHDSTRSTRLVSHRKQCANVKVCKCVNNQFPMYSISNN